MDGWKIATVVSGIVAAGAVGYAWHAHRRMKKGPPAAATDKGGKEAKQESVGLAALQVLKGSKAVAEAAKESQLGEVRAQDRAAEKAVTKGG